MSAPAAVAAVPDPRRWYALLFLSFTVLLVSLDQTVLNVALPTLVEDLHPTASELQWIADGYTLTNAVLLLLGGALGDRYGRRLVFLLGLAVFGAGSLACALADTAGLLVAARVVTGVGAAFLMPTTLAIIASTFTGAERAKAIGVWAGTSGIGSAAGPLFGGWLLEHFWWGSIFLINVPVAAVGLVGGLAFVAESRAQRAPRIDATAVVLSAAGLAAITYALIVAPSEHWDSGIVIGAFVAGATLLAAFFWWDARQERPFVDLSLFRYPVFATATGIISTLFFAMFGVSFLISQYVQFVQGRSAFGVGLSFVPLAVATLLTSNLAAPLTARFGLRAVLLAGLGSITAGLCVLATVDAHTGFGPVGTALGLIGAGMGFAIPPTSNAIMATLRPDEIGAGSGLRSTVQLLGGSFGVAVIGTLATSRYRAHIGADLDGRLASVAEPARSSIGDQIGHATLAAERLPAGLANATRAAAASAFSSAVALCAVVAAVLAAVTMVAAARFIPARPRPSGAPAADTSAARARVDEPEVVEGA